MNVDPGPRAAIAVEDRNQILASSSSDFRRASRRFREARTEVLGSLVLAALAQRLGARALRAMPALGRSARGRADGDPRGALTPTSR